MLVGFWPANAPYGLNGPGSSSIADPDGRPLNNALNPSTGGVYVYVYVCNRGNDTIVRMRQDGTTVGVRRVRLDGHSLGVARLNGIATSTDGSRIWVTYVGALPGSDDDQGGVLELPAF